MFWGKLKKGGKLKKVSFAFTRMYPPVNFVSVNFDFQKLGLWSDPLLGQKPNLAVIYGSSYPERVIWTIISNLMNDGVELDGLS